MDRCPLFDTSPGSGRADAPAHKRAVETERRVIALVLGVEVGWVVLSVVHANDDAEEGRNYGH